jgi:hypothetical protein
MKKYESVTKINNKARASKTEFLDTPWIPRKLDVKFYQEPSGQWRQVIKDGQPLPATDCQVNLWLRVCELERALENVIKAISREWMVADNDKYTDDQKMAALKDAATAVAVAKDTLGVGS